VEGDGSPVRTRKLPVSSPRRHSATAVVVTAPAHVSTPKAQGPLLLKHLIERELAQQVEAAAAAAETAAAEQAVEGEGGADSTADGDDARAPE
jgi:hypothetical protein